MVRAGLLEQGLIDTPQTEIEETTVSLPVEGMTAEGLKNLPHTVFCGIGMGVFQPFQYLAVGLRLGGGTHYLTVGLEHLTPEYHFLFRHLCCFYPRSE